MEWLVLTVSFALVIVALTVLVEKCAGYMRRRLRLFSRWNQPGPPEYTLCFGDQTFRLGMLYTAYHDRPLIGTRLIWNEETIRGATETTDSQTNTMSCEVITDDSLNSKLKHIGLSSETDLAISVASKLIQTAKSANYLQDIRKSARQARVVLHCKCTGKTEMLNMKNPVKVYQSDLLETQSATHVVVGVGYGAQAFFVFDKNVSEAENYNEICKQMRLLISKLPEIAKGNVELLKEEKPLASQLHCTLHSDFYHIDTPYTFKDAIITLRSINTQVRLNSELVPKKAWIYPLHSLDKSVLSAQCIEPLYATKIVMLFDKLHSLELTINDLLKHKVCRSFDSIHKQLQNLHEAIMKRQIQKEMLRKLIPYFRQNKRSQKTLVNFLCVTEMIDSYSVFTEIDQWLSEKEKEMSQISDYLTLLECPDIKFHLSQEQFNSFIRNKGDTYTVSLEFELVDQSGSYDPEALCRCQFNDDDVRSKIKEFTKFAHECQEANCIVTISHDSNASQHRVILRLYGPTGSSCPSDFKFPVRMGKPIITSAPTSDSIELNWPIAPVKEHLVAYTIFFRSTADQKWQKQDFEATTTHAILCGLEADTEYEVKVVPKYKYGMGPESLVSDSIVTSKSPLAVQISRDETLSTVFKKSSPKQIFILKTRSVIRDDEKLIAKEEFGNPHHSKPTKVVMLMGATGAGKSTLINGMVNFILGVDYKHPFRFMLIHDDKKSQVHSVTNIITAYTFYWQKGFVIPYSLTIIDTPGFGDTRGIERDKLITTQVKEFFSIQGNNGIDQIHGIGFVTQSSLVRLTPTQKYIFDSILSIFGKDIEKNIFIMATFSDSVKPPVIRAVEAAKIPHTAFFPFNNSALYEDSENPFTKMFWDMGYISFDKFLNHLQQVTAISLQLTHEVLKEREQLESILNGIYPKLQDGLSKIDTLQKEETILRARDSDVKANKDFKYKVKITKQQKKKLKVGTYVTNCLVCNFTCHNPCGISNDDSKFRCAAMDDGGPEYAKCKVCPQKCGWQHHVNNQYYFEIYEEEESRTSEDLLKRYNVANGDKDAAEQVISGLHNELADLSKVVYADVREARHCIERLGEIALKPNPMTEVEYIDLLIESEKQEKRQGFNDRVAAYMKMRKQAQIMGKMSDKQIDEELEQKDNTKWWQFWKW